MKRRDLAAAELVEDGRRRGRYATASATTGGNVFEVKKRKDE